MCLGERYSYLPTVSVAAAESADTVAAGETLQFSATVMNGSDPVESPTITWSLSGQAQAGTSIDASSGLLTVSVDEAADTEPTITATYNDGTDHTGSATVTVTAGA